MLKWKPANTREAVLAVQNCIKQYPNSFDFRQCYYFVTDSDISDSLGKDLEDLKKENIDEALRGLGLDLTKEVHDIGLGKAVGFFVPEDALKRAGINIPEWDTKQQLSTTHSRYRR